MEVAERVAECRSTATASRSNRIMARVRTEVPEETAALAG